jgi:Squalene/phytoene synthase
MVVRICTIRLLRSSNREPQVVPQHPRFQPASIDTSSIMFYCMDGSKTALTGPPQRRRQQSLVQTNRIVRPCDHKHESTQSHRRNDNPIAFRQHNNNNNHHKYYQPLQRLSQLQSQRSYVTYDTSDRQLAKNDLQYCIQLVKERDYENGYICGLLLPPHMQSAYFTLRAWNVELASIKDTSTVRYNQRNETTESSSSSSSSSTSSSAHDPFEARTGAPPSILALQLRMQWWRNAIDTIYEAASSSTPPQLMSSISHQSQFSSSTSYWKNPVIRSLHRAVTTNTNSTKQDTSTTTSNTCTTNTILTKRWMERIIDIREADLQVDQYPTISDASVYAEETVSNLLFLTLECVNNNNVKNPTTDSPNRYGSHLDDIVTAAGIGIGLTTLLRATPHRLIASSSSSSQQSLDMPLPSELFRDNFPYQYIVATFMKDTAADTTSIVRQSTNDIDPTNTELQLKLQRHIQQGQLSLDDTNQFHNAIRTMANTSREQLVYAYMALQQQNQQGGRRDVTYEQKMCFLSILPSIQYLHQLEHVYDYNVFDYVKMQQTKPYVVAKDRIRLLYQLGRTYMTGIY